MKKIDKAMKKVKKVRRLKFSTVQFNKVKFRNKITMFLSTINKVLWLEIVKMTI